MWSPYNDRHILIIIIKKYTIKILKIHLADFALGASQMKIQLQTNRRIHRHNIKTIDSCYKMLN